MKSCPSSDVVLSGLGEEFCRAIVRAKSQTLKDYDDYKQRFPEFVADHTQRGLANWLHDRYWQHVVAETAAVAVVIVIDSEPTRELLVPVSPDGYCRARVKRHHTPSGAVASYPTRAATAFMHQPQLDLLGLADQPVYHLIIGYEWDRSTHPIGRATLSLRDGIDNVVWLKALDDEQAEPVAPVPLRPPVGSPPDPSLDMVGQADIASSPEAEDAHR